MKRNPNVNISGLWMLSFQLRKYAMFLFFFYFSILFVSSPFIGLYSFAHIALTSVCVCIVSNYFFIRCYDFKLPIVLTNSSWFLLFPYCFVLVCGDCLICILFKWPIYRTHEPYSGSKSVLEDLISLTKALAFTPAECARSRTSKPVPSISFHS